jgi:hypothetical protein
MGQRWFCGKVEAALYGILDVFFSFYVRYSTLLYQPPLRFDCVGGCWDKTQDCCDFTIDNQTL